MTPAALCRVLPLLVALLSGCAGGIDVRSTHDHDVDFAKLHTFDWLPPPSEADGGVNDATVLGLIGSELESKGLQRSSGNSDLLVAVHRTMEGAQDTKKWGYDFENGHFERFPLQEGTLVVDLLAAKNRQSIWRGTASGAFRVEVGQQKRREMLTEVIHDMFKDFPPRR